MALTTAAVLITAGCGSDSSDDGAATSTPPSTISPADMPDHQAPPNRLIIDVTIKGGEVTPTNAELQGKVKEPIVIRVNSDVADELHVHSNPEHTFTVESKPGQSFQFTVDVPGKVAVELHQLKRTIANIEVR